MKNRVQRILSLGVLAAVVTAMGCRPPPSKRGFNDVMAKESAKLSAAAAGFRIALFGQPGGKNFDPESVPDAPLKASVEGMEAAVKKSISVIEDLDLPRNSSAASGLKSAFEKYLNDQKAIAEKSREIYNVKNNADGKYPSKADKVDRITKLLIEIADIEGSSYKQVQEAQKAYCDAHHFKLVTRYD